MVGINNMKKEEKEDHPEEFILECFFVVVVVSEIISIRVSQKVTSLVI